MPLSVCMEEVGGEGSLHVKKSLQGAETTEREKKSADLLVNL